MTLLLSLSLATAALTVAVLALGYLATTILARVRDVEQRADTITEIDSALVALEEAVYGEDDEPTQEAPEQRVRNVLSFSDFSAHKRAARRAAAAPTRATIDEDLAAVRDNVSTWALASVTDPGAFDGKAVELVKLGAAITHYLAPAESEG